ncbi:GAF domain-containing sensor histidine kinase [Kineosporia sp. R_H_3]|uniref:GAF domain-containing sensor histidine kinase n=1 Tax=Kineosporia sp. R_H_3 TaxID=1961848 RepID=UPI000B4C1CCB|nr:GAF domain-containing sensor histidine kinase [Kineosporia sp. R_H_3]
MASDDPRRVRALLDAVIAVGEGLDLDEVLDRIASTACELTGARYGALGVQDDEGRVVGFHSHGMDHALDAEQRAALGGRPSGSGLPGLLLRDDAEPLRLSNLAEHPRFVGFPDPHPRMTAFLGVPLRVAGSTFGNLYVADPPTGDFTADDEEALQALASAAGVAVGNARLYRAARRRQTWWEAASQAVQAVVDAGPAGLPAALDAVAGIAAAAAEADEAVVRLGTDTERAPDAAPAEAGAPGGAAPGDAVRLELPLAVGAQPIGTMTLTWHEGPGPDHEDTLLARTFGERVALAVEASRAASDREALAVLQDRDRIAQDLHDLVIQRLFAVGLSLQAAGNVARVPEVARRLARAVDDLDDTIKDVRRTIFQLHGTAVRSPLRDELEELVATARADLGVAVRLVVEGPILAVPDDLAPEVLAVAREALSNVAKHAHAHRVEVSLRIGRSLELTVTDDGDGTPPGGRRSGLANLEERATRHGGTFRLRSEPGTGTTLLWSVPRR